MMESWFEKWWREVGSKMHLIDGEILEKFAHRVALDAWNESERLNQAPPAQQDN